jgi:hypothetical protein
MSENEVSDIIEKAQQDLQPEQNRLFPVFLKLDQLDVLLVGAGNIGFEKLQSLLKNAPDTKITIVAGRVSADVKNIAAANNQIKIIERNFEPADLDEKDLVLVAIDDSNTSSYIRVLARERKLLLNVADTPALCDFYLGSIVQKGNLKIAISTNGKSPTIAKRLKEQISRMLPDEIESVLQNMQIIRKDLSGDFAEKVKKLDALTSVLAAKQITLEAADKPEAKKWPRIVKWCLFAFFFMLVGHGLLSYAPSFNTVIEGIQSLTVHIDKRSFLIMLLTGFLAQMADGSLGMGYGTIATTFLLANGVNPAIVSSRVHTARVFSSGVSGYSHHRFGNINKKLFMALVLPGVVGAIIGAGLAVFLQQYSSFVRIPLSLYTIYLGYYIMRKAFQKKRLNEKVTRAGWLASAGGFVDAFAGGGWGTLVTSTLMSKRKSPRYVIGSVCLAEFFVVFVSSITFFILLKNIPVIDVAGLIAGGMIAAPIAARLVGKLPLRSMFILVGIFVILASLNTLWKVLTQVPHLLH